MSVRPSDERTILLVEDNPGDVDIVVEILRENDPTPPRVVVAADGVEALESLRRSRPDLVLLDLNLPRMDGRTVLRQMKSDPELRRIPVVIFSSSKAERDLLETYDLGANCFLTKPADIDEYFVAVRAIKEFWLSRVVLPSSPRGSAR